MPWPPASRGSSPRLKPWRPWLSLWPGGPKPLRPVSPFSSLWLQPRAYRPPGKGVRRISRRHRVPVYRLQRDGIAVAQTVKASLPDCTVVLGGHHPTALPAAAMADPAVDLVLRGEGEVGLPALAAALKSGGSLAECAGHRVPQPRRIPSYQRAGPLPGPGPAARAYFGLIRRKFYQRDGRDSIVTTAGRGCPLSCSYCATGKGLVDGVQKTIGVGRAAGNPGCASAGRRVGFVDFEDENLTMDRQWFLELMKGDWRAFSGIHA
jgi:anaerobic magnesium-protoporphyrin IX monomethyl ester cyclase